MNWNKPLQPAKTIYLSPRVRQYLLAKGSDALVGDWLGRIQAYVQEAAKANADSEEDRGFYTGPLILDKFPKFRRLGAVVANASYALTDENQNSLLIEYTVHIGFAEEQMEIDSKDWYALTLERKSKQS